MNYESSIARFIILSALIGFLAFICCYSYVVWRNRQIAAVGKSRWSHRLRALGWVLLLLGIFCVGFSMASREVIKAPGIITGEDLFTVRTIEGFHASYRANEGPVRKNDKLVSFDGPEFQLALSKARAAVMQHEAQLHKTEAELLPRDPELVRQLNRASQRVDQLEIMLRQLLPNSELSIREGLTETTKLKNELHKIEGEYQAAQAVEQQALATLEIIRRQLVRDEKLADRGAVPFLEYEERLIQYRKAEAEKIKAQATRIAIEAQKKEIQQALQKWSKLTDTTQIPKEFAQIQQDLIQARAEEIAAKKALEADLPRAQRLHALAVVQAKRELDGARETLTSLEQSREIVAPFNGRVIYKNPSQDTPKLRGPLLVLCGEQGLVCQVRLPEKQIDALEVGDRVALLASTEPNAAPFRFHATFKDQVKSSGIDPLITAIFQCFPPPEVVAKLVDGEPLIVTLDWKPPLWTLWPFRWGVGLGIVGLLFWFVSGVVAIPVLSASSVESSPPPESTLPSVPRSFSPNVPNPLQAEPLSRESSESLPVFPSFAHLENEFPSLAEVSDSKPSVIESGAVVSPRAEMDQDIEPPVIEPVAPPTLADMDSVAARETLPEVDVSETFEKPDYEQIAWNLCQSIHAGSVTPEQILQAERALFEGGAMATMYYRRIFRNDPILLNSIHRLWMNAETPETHHLVLRLDRLIASVGIVKPSGVSS